MSNNHSPESKKKTYKKFPANMNLMIPQREVAYPIPKREWYYLKEKIMASGAKLVDIFMTLVGVCFGIFGSAIIAAVSTISSTGWKSFESLFCLFAAALFLICGLVILLFALSRKRDRKENTVSIVKQMELIEKRCE